MAQNNEEKTKAQQAALCLCEMPTTK